MKVGYSENRDFNIKNDRIGPKGIQVLTLQSDKKKNTFILFD